MSNNNLEVIRNNLIGSLRRCEDEMNTPHSVMNRYERPIIDFIRNNNIDAEEVLRLLQSHYIKSLDVSKPT